MLNHHVVCFYYKVQGAYNTSNEDEIIQPNVNKQTRQECRLDKNWMST